MVVRGRIDLLTERHKEIAGKIWEIANRLRGPYRPPQYRLVMLPWSCCAASIACWSRPRMPYWRSISALSPPAHPKTPFPAC